MAFQEWLGNSLTPTEWGWRKVRQTLIPISSNLPPAPESFYILSHVNADLSVDQSAHAAFLAFLVL
ncbi:hypothetical protein PR048_021129 [Dryococelus australis]|uniref:Uncharacterized protein n=1 Tax=Dryococelus australis TaxID=614101 RepID=A0ABQ9GXD6_9NEOP|nr:hypothetical protein PR048_021129 [Dryococelus australis]